MITVAVCKHVLDMPGLTKQKNKTEIVLGCRGRVLFTQIISRDQRIRNRKFNFSRASLLTLGMSGRIPW